MPSEAVPVTFDKIPLTGTAFTGGTGTWLSLLDRRLGAQIAVETGPATVRAASSAAGGSVIVTPFTSEPARGKGEFTATGRFNTRFASADTGRDAHARIAGGYEDFGAIAAGSVAFTDTRMNGAQEDLPYSSYENYSAFFTGDWAITRDSGNWWHTAVGYLFAQSHNTADLTLLSSETPVVDIYDRSAHLAWGRLSMALLARALSGDLTLFYQHASEEVDSVKVPLPTITYRPDTRDRTRVNTIGISANFTAQLIPDTFDLRYGALYTHDLLAADHYIRTGTDTSLTSGGYSLLPDESSTDHFSGYLHGTYELLPPTGAHRLAAVAGYRFDGNTFRAPARDETPAVKATVPGHGAEAGLVYTWRENFGAALTYGHGTRTATLREAASYGIRTGLFFVPNGNLAPETSDTLDLTLRTKTKHLTVRVSGFATSLNDRIALARVLWNGRSTADGTPIVGYVNIGRALIWGISAEEAFTTPFGLSLIGGATYLWGEEKRKDHTIAVLETIPPLLWHLALRWEAPEPSEYRGFAEVAIRASTDTRSAAKGGIITVPAVLPLTGPWQTLAVRGGFIFDDNIRVILSVENLLDRTYRPALASIDGSGISAVLSLDAEF